MHKLNSFDHLVGVSIAKSSPQAVHASIDNHMDVQDAGGALHLAAIFAVGKNASARIAVEKLGPVHPDLKRKLVGTQTTYFARTSSSVRAIAEAGDGFKAASLSLSAQGSARLDVAVRVEDEFGDTVAKTTFEWEFSVCQEAAV